MAFFCGQNIAKTVWQLGSTRPAGEAYSAPPHPLAASGRGGRAGGKDGKASGVEGSQGKRIGRGKGREKGRGRGGEGRKERERKEMVLVIFQNVVAPLYITFTYWLWYNTVRVVQVHF